MGESLLYRPLFSDTADRHRLFLSDVYAKFAVSRIVLGNHGTSFYGAARNLAAQKTFISQSITKFIEVRDRLEIDGIRRVIFDKNTPGFILL